MSNNVQMLEAWMEGLFKNEVVNPYEVLCALHNCCAHGKAIEETGGYLDKEGKILGEIFDGFDKSLKALKDDCGF